MKNAIIITLTLLVGIIGSNPAVFGIETLVFGPQQYVRTSGSPDHYIDNFRAIPGEGNIIVKNGKSDGEKRIADSVSSAAVFINGVEVFGPNDFSKNIYLLNSTLELNGENTLSITLASSPDSQITVEITEDISPPTVTLDANPDEARSGQSVILKWDSNDADSVTILPDVGQVEASGETTVFPVEDMTYTITATGLGGTATQSIHVRVLPLFGPIVKMSVEPAVINQGESAILTWTVTDAESISIDNAIGDVPPSGSLTIYPDHTTVYTITATGPSGSSGAQAGVAVAGTPEPQIEGSFGKQYEDLIPADATVVSYDPLHFSVVTGIVQDVSDLVLDEVRITVLDNPQYGTAVTGPDGRFSIPIEGGGSVTIIFRKQDHIEVHRRIYVPWNDVATVGAINMIKADPVYTVVEFDGNPQTVVNHQSTRISDRFGTRTCTMVFTGDNRAVSVDREGNNVQVLNVITTRATEYTTQSSMPAELPPN